MSKKKELIPELRFPEFVDEGEWEEKVLGEICNVTNGKANVQDHVENGKYPLFDRSEVIKASNDFIFDCEAVIIPGEGMRFIPKYYKGKFNLHQRAYALKNFICNGHFVYYSMLHRSALLSQKAVQSTVLSLRLPILQSFSINIPKNPKEQQKIASCLSSLDEVISDHNQKLEQLKDHKKGLMQNLFPQEGEKVPKSRFPEFVNTKDWVVKKLIETTDRKVKWSFTGGPFGSNLKANDYTAKGIRIIQLQNIGDGEFNDEYKIYTSEKKADELLSSNIYSGEIILSKMGDPVGRACIIPDFLKRSIMASDGIRLVVDEKKYSKYFIYSLINSKRIRSAIEKKATGSTRKRIGLDELKEIELIVPKSLTEQQKIASCLSALNELITAQIKKIEQLKLHKKGLMQRLFPKIEN
jgi:type I restriction enzyme S subunit